MKSFINYKKATNDLFLYDTKMFKNIFVEYYRGDRVEETADGCGDSNGQEEIEVECHDEPEMIMVCSVC